GARAIGRWFAFCSAGLPTGRVPVFTDWPSCAGNLICANMRPALPRNQEPRMNLEDFCLLYEYNSWANRRSLDACSTLTDEQFTRDIGSSFRSVRDTLSHICEVEWLWLERWHGRSAICPRPGSEFPPLDSLRRRWQEVETSLIGYVDALKAEDITRIVEHKTTKGVPQAEPLWQMLQHLVNH